MHADYSVIDLRALASSVFEKLPDELRARVDQALIEGDPAPVQSVFDEFKLADHGVSRSAFYRYARRVRVRLAAFNLTELLPPDAPDPAETLQRGLALRMMVALDENDPPRVLEQLSKVWRVASNVLSARRREQKQISPDVQRLSDLMHHYADLVRQRRDIEDRRAAQKNDPQPEDADPKK